MFKRLHEDPTSVIIEVDGRPVKASANDSVAAALLAAPMAEKGAAFRTSAVGGVPRAPHCMIGNCFECLVEIDGVPNRQACLVTVREGMRVRRQAGAPRVTS